MYRNKRILVSVTEDLMRQFKETGDPKTFYDQLMPVEECNEVLGIRDWNPPGMFLE